MENVELRNCNHSFDVAGGNFETEMISVKIFQFKNGEFAQYLQKAKELAEKIVELLKEMEL